MSLQTKKYTGRDAPGRASPVPRPERAMTAAPWRAESEVRNHHLSFFPPPPPLRACSPDTPGGTCMMRMMNMARLLPLLLLFALAGCREQVAPEEPLRPVKSVVAQ